ncbi:hypothetical protein JOE09_003493 [Pantoea coffeiphila]|nr:hypothetical protein [Pantoea coffeiphila]
MALFAKPSAISRNFSEDRGMRQTFTKNRSYVQVSGRFHAGIEPCSGKTTVIICRTGRDAHFRCVVCKVWDGAGWLCPRSGGPRAAARFLHFARQSDGSAQTRVLRGCAFRPLPCGRILASSLRSALWIARSGAQPACFLTFTLPEKPISSSFFHNTGEIPTFGAN